MIPKLIFYQSKNYLSFDTNFFYLLYNDRIGFTPVVDKYFRAKSQRGNVGDALILGVESLTELNIDRMIWKNNTLIDLSVFFNFSSINSAGKIAMKLDNNDKIVGVKICKDNQDAILSTKFGKCIRFESKKLRVFKGRSSKGIKGIELAPNDEIVSLSIINSDKIKQNGIKSKNEKRYHKIYLEECYGGYNS